ncbi:hypothetical protein [Taklimakanibacter lacteus]|uniref:hypothetical protein n=1 Tax=Taklimakanibacter lacteus TaxID=2268456 RepID=UPI0013C52D94
MSVPAGGRIAFRCRMMRWIYEFDQFYGLSLEKPMQKRDLGEQEGRLKPSVFAAAQKSYPAQSHASCACLLSKDVGINFGYALIN